MKRKIIVLLSIAICVCTVILIFVQGSFLRTAGQVQKEGFSAKMSMILDNVIANAEAIEELRESRRGTLEEFGEKSYRSIGGSKKVSKFGSSFNLKEDLELFLTIHENDLQIAQSDKRIKKILGDSMSKGKKDLSLFDDDFQGLSGLSRKAWVEEKTEITVTIDRDITERISKERIDSLIEKEFKEKGINTKFEFAVRDANIDNVDSLCTAGFRSDRVERVYTSPLFPFDSEQAPKYYLSIYVPHLTDYIFRELFFVVLISFLLVFIVVGTFAATLIIIFRQKRLSQMRSDFMGNMTHELKTPIATIALAAEMLQDKNVPNEKKNISGLSKMVRDEAQRLSSLVERVLRMAAFESGNVSLKKRNVNIKYLLYKTIDNYALQFNSKKAKVSTQYGAKNNIVFGDEMHLSQIISNLIDNALKYSKTNPEIHISTKNEGSGILITVADNGIGIDKEYHKHVFEQFYRVPTGNIHAVKGSGLGLNYVKNIVEAHDGKVSFDSEKDKGSTFVIFLPNKIDN